MAPGGPEMTPGGPEMAVRGGVFKGARWSSEEWRRGVEEAPKGGRGGGETKCAGRVELKEKNKVVDTTSSLRAGRKTN